MISITILTKNSEKYLRQVLESVKGFPEVIVLDTGSTDTTKEIALSFSNVKLFSRPFTGFGPTHNIASSLASHDWILSLDSDEIISSELKKEIDRLALDEKAVYTIPRKNIYRGKHIKGCGWHPDRVKRLYNRKSTRFSDALVHETVLTENMRTVDLQQPLLHFPYDTIQSFLKKLDAYSTLYAEQNAGKKRISFLSLWSHTIWAFLRSYILKNGWMLGKEGLEISIYNANSTFYKYLKLIEKNQEIDRQTKP